jgi:predicted nucleic acid-binding protein
MRAWYLDTSAFVKLVRVEPHSVELRRWLRARETAGDVIASSDLLRAEAIRVARRVDERSLIGVVLSLLNRIAMIQVDGAVFERAGYVGSPSLRSLDAVHLAAAQELGDDLSAVVAYDERLLAAAGDVGLPTLSPPA